MNKTLYIKNMVCDRCNLVVTDELKKLNVKVISVELGKVVLGQIDDTQLIIIEQMLISNGFVLMKETDQMQIEDIKLYLRSLVNILPIQLHKNLSVILSQRLGRSYSSISKIFSKSEELTIEKYYLKLKIEKAKELVQLNKYSFSEIAALLDYSSSNHLAKQFKTETGLSMTGYKNAKNWNRLPLDKITL